MSSRALSAALRALADELAVPFSSALPAPSGHYPARRHSALGAK